MSNIIAHKTLDTDPRIEGLWFTRDPKERAKSAQRFNSAPLERWNLSVRTLNTLLRFDRKLSIGDVVRADVKITKIRQMGIKTLLELDDKVQALLDNPDRVLENLVTITEPRRALQVLPTLPISSTGRLNLPFFIAELTKLILLTDKTQRDYEVIKRHFGLEQNPVDKLSAIARACNNISRERVRQIEARNLDYLRRVLAGKTVSANVQIPQNLIDEFLFLKERLEALRAIEREARMLEEVASIYGIELTHLERLALRLLFTLYSYAELGSARDHLYSALWVRNGIAIRIHRAWQISSSPNRKDVALALWTLNRILREGIVEFGYRDLKSAVNRLAGNKSVSDPALQLALYLCANTETPREDVYQRRFDRLASYRDMAFRVLFEKGKPLRLDEIISEINQRLAGSKRSLLRPTAANLFRTDERFKLLRKSGLWALAEWSERVTNVPKKNNSL